MRGTWRDSLAIRKLVFVLISFILTFLTLSLRVPVTLTTCPSTSQSECFLKLTTWGMELMTCQQFMVHVLMCICTLVITLAWKVRGCVFSTLVKNTCSHDPCEEKKKIHQIAHRLWSYFVNQWDFSYGFAIVNFVLNKNLHCFCDRKCANSFKIQPIQTDLGKHSFHAISNACTCHSVVICPLFLFLVSPVFELSLYFFQLMF